MITHENIKDEIKELLEGELTPDTMEALAHLIYIDEHFPEPEAKTRTLSHEEACQWVRHMENADGTMGARWSMDATEDVRIKHGIDCEPLSFWVAMNMMYSDYVTAAEKAGCNTAEFYACMAKAFLTDPDARPGKLERYYRHIARHG